jgi:hypothetical protein
MKIAGEKTSYEPKYAYNELGTTNSLIWMSKLSKYLTTKNPFN